MSCSCARSQHGGGGGGAADTMPKVEDLLRHDDPTLLVSWVREENLTDSTLTRLDQLVTKELCAGGFSGVGLFLKSLRMLSENRDDLQTLLSLGITAKAMLWFEVVQAWLTSDRHRNSASLHSLTEEFFECFQLLSQAPLPQPQLSALLLLVLQVTVNRQVRFPLRLEAIRTFNSILEFLSRKQKKLVQNDDSYNNIMLQMADAVLTGGDYELQVSQSEALCRLTPARRRLERATHWFSSTAIRDSFCAIRDADFEVDCRHFLNFVNRFHRHQRRVYTFPCLRAFVNSIQLFQPKDEKLAEFWVDFNVESSCVSFFVDEQASLWGSVHLQSDEVDTYRLFIRSDEAVLSVRLNNPIIHQGGSGQAVELTFNRVWHGELEEAVGRVFTVPSPPRSPGAGGDVQASTSAGQRSGQSYGRTKQQRRSQLKVLPLSSPSSNEESSVSMCDPRSRAEVLFDQIRTPSPGRHPAAVLRGTSRGQESVPVGAEPHASQQQGAAFQRNVSPEMEPGGVEPASEEEEEELVGHNMWSVPESWAEPKFDSESDITAVFSNLHAKLEAHFLEYLNKVEGEFQFSPTDGQQHVSSLLTAAHQRRQLLLQMSESVTHELKRMEEQCIILNSISTKIMRFVQSERRRLASFWDEVLQRWKSLKVED